MSSTTSTKPTSLTILTAGHPGWDEARRAFNLAVDQQPVAIARPGSAQDLQVARQDADHQAYGSRLRAPGTTPARWARCPTPS